MKPLIQSRTKRLKAKLSETGAVGQGDAPQPAQSPAGRRPENEGLGSRV